MPGVVDTDFPIILISLLLSRPYKPPEDAGFAIASTSTLKCYSADATTEPGCPLFPPGIRGCCGVESRVGAAQAGWRVTVTGGEASGRERGRARRNGGGVLARR